MSQQSDMMNAALTKAAQRDYPGLAGSTGFPGGKPGANTPQFKPVKQSKPAKAMPKVAKPKMKSLVKTRNQMAAPKTPAQKAFMAPFSKVKNSVRKSMGY